MIRKAEKKDIKAIAELLFEVQAVHAEKRPDLFKKGSRKYSDIEIESIINDEKTPVFVYEKDGAILGYAFCIFIRHENNSSLTDIKTLYIDDLCVKEGRRGEHIGKQLYEYVLEFAKSSGCYNLTLNVWELNDGAKKFYEKMGLLPQKTGMEKIL